MTNIIQKLRSDKYHVHGGFRFHGVNKLTHKNSYIDWGFNNILDIEIVERYYFCQPRTKWWITQLSTT